MRKKIVAQQDIVAYFLRMHHKTVVFMLIGVFATCGALAILLTHAATSQISFEPENGVMTSGVSISSDVSASAGKYAQFADGGSASVTFQPAAPYHATFFYPWYKNTKTDGGYSYWQDAGNSPPNTWFSHFLPDKDPAQFDPTNELYSSNDYSTFKWQLSKLAEAKQEVAIASWFGQGTKQDTAIKTYLNDFMKRPDNPYPNLRWALYYECEGIATAGASSCTSSTATPSTADIAADLTYIKNYISSSPYFLTINGRPVIFVYGDVEGPDTLVRWRDANAQLGNYFYIVQKVFSGYATASPQPDSWHQYGPASNYGIHSPHSAYVSPGFWKDVSDPVDGIVRLGRDLNRFQTDVTKLASANVTWRLVETWNEWGEGSSVEPGTQTLIDGNGKEVADPNAAPFGNVYVQALADRLPPLEQGTGAVAMRPSDGGVAASQFQVSKVPRVVHRQLSKTTSWAHTIAAKAATVIRGFRQSFEPKQAFAQAASSSFVFASGGDIGANSSTTATYAKLDTSNAQFFMALGDLDYDETATDADWCSYTKASLPTLFTNPNYPFEIVTGNHEEQGGPDGYVMNHAACLPDRMSSTGTYPAQYFFDYPKTNPLMRVIMISPNLTVENTKYEYTNGTIYTTWLLNAIDQARAAGIPWITVGMHKNCLSAGTKSCEISEDLTNMLVAKKVDIILQGHEHNYQRSHQLSHNGSSCTALSSAIYNANCVVARTDPNVYTKGSGPVQVIDGIVGRSGTNYPISTSDPSYPYMVKAVADGTNRGFVKWTVMRDRIDAQFVASAGTLTDSFSIVSSGTTPVADLTPPSVSLSAPNNGAIVSGSFALTATASDNVAVARVEFYIDGQLVNSDATGPYQFAWDSTTVPNGSHTVQAKAYDSSNNTTSSSLATITVSNGCPAPPAGTYGLVTSSVAADAGTYNVWVRMMAADTSNNSVGLVVGTACPLVMGDNAAISSSQWTWVNYKDANTSSLAQINLTTGSQAVTLYGREAGVKVDRVLLLATTCVPTGTGDNCAPTADTTPPTVSISAPTSGTTMTGQTAFSATASDASGISKVEFYADNLLVASDTTSPYSTTLDTTTLSDGSHTLQAKAYDAVGNIGTSANVSVTSSNGTSPSLQGDMNGDRLVNVYDLSILLSKWGKADAMADVNKDGTVNVYDLSLLLAGWTG